MERHEIPDKISSFQSWWSCIHSSGQNLGSSGVVTPTLGIRISECETAGENFRPPLYSTIIRLSLSPTLPLTTIYLSLSPTLPLTTIRFFLSPTHGPKLEVWPWTTWESRSFAPRDSAGRVPTSSHEPEEQGGLQVPLVEAVGKR